MNKKLPKRSESQRIGTTSEEILKSIFGEFCNVISTQDSKDFGIDMRAELIESGYPTGIHFNIQCKGTEIIKSDNDNFLDIPIKITTLNYWRQQSEPVFLIIVNKKEKYIYWGCPLNDLKRPLEDLKNQEKVIIKVSKDNFCEYNITYLPKNMLEIINEHYFDLIQKVAFIMKSLNNKVDKFDDMDKSHFQEIIKMDKAANNILESIEVIEELNNELRDKVLKNIESEVNKFFKILSKTEGLAYVRKVIDSSSVYDEKFGGITPRELSEEVKTCLKIYKENKNNENYQNLLQTLKKITTMKTDLKYFFEAIDNEAFGRGY